MSTYQPPGGQQPEGSPPYTPPQDPWAGGFEPGQASVPTDPIPQQYGSYAPSQGEVWSQPTVQHGSPYGYVPQPAPKSRAGMFVLIFLIVLILGGGGGVGAWYFVKDRNTVTDSPTSTPTASTPAAIVTCPVSSDAGAFDPCSVKTGDCLFNNGTTEEPNLGIVQCSTPKSFKVIKISKGAAIPEGPDGKFDKDTTSVSECAGTNYQSWYGYQHATDRARDVFFCMTNNP